MIVAVVRIEPEAELRTALDAERLLQLGDEKVPLAKLRSNGPAGFWVAIDRVLRAVILLFPIGSGFGEEDGIAASRSFQVRPK